MIFGENPMDKEMRKQQQERLNKDFLVYGLGFLLIIIGFINPIGALVGLILDANNRIRAFLISLVSFILSIISVILYSLIGNVPVSEQFINYGKNIFYLKEGRVNFLEFLLHYLFSPVFLLFFSFAIVSGIIGHYYFVTTGKDRFTKNQSLRRLDKTGNEVFLFDNITPRKLLSNAFPKKRKILSNTDINGILLGKNNDNEDVFLTDDETVAHGGIYGTTGSGKTNTMMLFVKSCAERKKSMFYIDGKGDKDLPAKFRKIAEYYGVPFYHFDMTGSQSDICYNPLELGNIDNTKEKIIDTQDWSEEHYKSAASRTLLFVCRLIDQFLKETKGFSENDFRDFLSIREGEKVPRIKKDIITIQKLLTPAFHQLILSSIKNEDIKEKLTEICDDLEEEWYKGLRQRLALISESSVGELLSDSGKGIKLTNVMKEKAIILFSLNSLENPDVTKMLGRLIVKDINTAITMKEDKDAVYSIYDEHGAYVSPDIGNQLAMARSFGMRVITSTQNISDYENTPIGEVLLRRVIGNINFILLMKLNEGENVEYLSKNVGTQKVRDKTISTDDIGNFKGEGIKHVEEFIINPNLIKNFSTGEAALIKKIPKLEIERYVKINYFDVDALEKKLDEKEEIKVEEKELNEN
jgi:hypothetical protein